MGDGKYRDDLRAAHERITQLENNLAEARAAAVPARETAREPEAQARAAPSDDEELRNARERITDLERRLGKTRELAKRSRADVEDLATLEHEDPAFVALVARREHAQRMLQSSRLRFGPFLMPAIAGVTCLARPASDHTNIQPVVFFVSLALAFLLRFVGQRAWRRRIVEVEDALVISRRMRAKAVSDAAATRRR